MKKETIKWIIAFLGFGVPYLFIYRAFFMGGPLSWGDAPFFFPDALKNLFLPPLLWNFKDNNFGASQYYILWLYLPTFLYGILNHFLGLGNDFLVRLIFYFPATVLGFFGSWKLIGKFNQNIYGKFLGSSLYGFNTYLLMLVDGGQVGVALAYGIFPLAVFTLLNYLKSSNIKNYSFALVSLFALTASDLRITLIAILFTVLLWLTDKGDVSLTHFLKKLITLGVSLIGLCLYWIIPVLGGSTLASVGGLDQKNNFITLLNSFFLFQPHFPLNQFGKVFPTPLYFVFLPLLILGSLLLNKKKIVLKLAVLFLIFVFLAKGGSSPFGSAFTFIIDHLPFGVAFRDSSKFFIPLILLGSLLLSFTIDTLKQVVKNRWIFLALMIAIYGYLLFLIYPALLGNLTGVLKTKTNEQDYWKIYETLKNDENFARSLWFEERPALGFTSWNKPAISANTLYQDRPFASMIVGKYDFFNYLHSLQFCSWLDLLGVKYVFLPENERKKVVDINDQKDRQSLLSTIENSTCLSPAPTSLSFPAYQTIVTKPQIFAQQKAILVIGGEDIYDKLIKNSNFSLNHQGFIFAEGGRTNLNKLTDVGANSLILLFANKDLLDLKMSYMQDEMVSPAKASLKQWKIYDSSEYLIWKYEFLQHDINSREFDFGKGVATSTIPGEKMEFKLPNAQDGNYFLAIRYTNNLGSSLKVNLLGQEINFSNNDPAKFKWQIIGPIKVTGKSLDVRITSTGNFSALNTAALISEKDFQTADVLASSLTSRFQTVYLKQDEDFEKVSELLDSNSFPVQYQQVNPTQYKLVNLPSQPLWLTFSDHFDPNWVVVGNQQNIHEPFYAMINGFYLDGKSQNLTLFYLPQKRVWLSVYLSLISLGVIVVMGFVISFKK